MITKKWCIIGIDGEIMLDTIAPTDMKAVELFTEKHLGGIYKSWELRKKQGYQCVPFESSDEWEPT